MNQNNLETKKISYTAPSNIAFVKYWGKKNRQEPMNPSISMTLDSCHTKMDMKISRKKGQETLVKFLFEGAESQVFQKRISNYLDSIQDKLPWLDDYELEIESRNSFPHSSGIASSASAFAALAACLADFDAELKNHDFDPLFASELARLGSGSACRSIYPGFALWGKDGHTSSSTNHNAIQLSDVHPSFDDLCDSILIVSSSSKKVKSSAGHSLMNTHIFNELRYEQARDNYKDIINAMRQGDFKTFGEILENEALTLHALMMTSTPSFILLEPNSLNIINKVREFRDKTNTDLYFTIDAGPNIHLIFPGNISTIVNKFIKEELLQFCEDRFYIEDRIGRGIKKVVNDE